MAEPHLSGSDAFRWLDANMVASLESPDEAFDWVFMLKEKDWPLLEAIWSERSAVWREACAYILGECPTPPSQRLLRLALADAENAVASQAAVSLCAQLLQQPSEAQINGDLLRRLRELRGASGDSSMQEVDEFLRRHRGPG
jgi:hypothetical protein